MNNRLLSSHLHGWWLLLAIWAVAVPVECRGDSSSERIDDGAAPFRHGQWPFAPPVKPQPPSVVKLDWPANPIDQFLLSRLEQAGLRPNYAADKATLLRRVTYDLIGLPPTSAEMEA